MTRPQDAGDVIAFSRNTSQDLGNSTALDVKQQTSKFKELNTAIEALAQKEKQHFGLMCSAGSVIDNLPIETQGKLDLIMNNKNVHAGDIARLMKSFGFEISVEVLRRHRRRKTGTGCACK